MDGNLLGMWHRDRKLRMGCLNASASLGSGIRTFCKCTLCLHTRVVLPQGMQLQATQVHVLMVQGAWHRGVRNSLLCALMPSMSPIPALLQGHICYGEWRGSQG